MVPELNDEIRPGTYWWLTLTHRRSQATLAESAATGMWRVPDDAPGANVAAAIRHRVRGAGARPPAFMKVPAGFRTYTTRSAPRCRELDAHSLVPSAPMLQDVTALFVILSRRGRNSLFSTWPWIGRHSDEAHADLLILILVIAGRFPQSETA